MARFFRVTGARRADIVTSMCIGLMSIGTWAASAHPTWAGLRVAAGGWLVASVAATHPEVLARARKQDRES